MQVNFRRAAEAVLDGVFPRVCGLCGSATPGKTICAGCMRDLPWIEFRCPRCATPVPSAAARTPCANCQRRPPLFTQIYAPLHYEFPVDAVIKALKFRRRLDLAPMLADLLLPWLIPRASRFDGLVPVPLHRWRNARRGFNQAEELARRLRRETGLPLLHGVRRVRRTESQRGLSARERRRNVRAAFSASSRHAWRHPLIVDDVVTTGETCGEIARVLLAAGAERVSVLSVARAS